MQQRGRKTTANVVKLNVSGSPSRLTAPSHLNKAERTLFNELVDSCDPRHFVKSDLPLLASFVQATLLARSTSTKLGRSNPDAVAAWEKAVRVMAMLATRLRLAPQARSDPKTVGIRQRNTGNDLGVAPWQREEKDDE